MKIALLLALAVGPFAGEAVARENRYDLLARVLTPLVSVFAERSGTGNRALVLEGRLEQMTGVSAEAGGVRAEVSVQYPDKLRIHVPVQGEDLTICRNGQELWVVPKERAEALFDRLDKNRSIAPPDPNYRMAPFRLPIPEKEIVFLPALFEVTDAGDEALDGAPCAVLDLQLNPALAKSMKQQAWSARFWVRQDGKPARLAIRSQDGFQLSVRIDSIAYKRWLPPETWQPANAAQESVLKISPGRYDWLLRALGKGK